MVWFLSSDGHREACAAYRRRLASKLQALQPVYGSPLTEGDKAILRLPLAVVVDKRSNGGLENSNILKAYGKQLLAAQIKSNCLSDVLLPLDPTDVRVGKTTSAALSNPKPLLGVPISIKDVINVAGTSSTLGYSSRSEKLETKDAPLVRLLRDAGAQIVCKSAVPTGLLSFETESDLFGWTAHPFAHLLGGDSTPKTEFSPGGSTGGGATILAHSAALIEIGTDLGGSVRLPAAFTGTYGLRPTIGRFPSMGAQMCCPGLEGIESVGPMARSVADLEDCWRGVVEMKPWEYDYTCVPIPWRKVDFVLEKRKPKFAVMWNDGLLTPTPASIRALQVAASALRKQGCEVVDFDGPSPLETLLIGYSFTFSDGCAAITAPLRPSETVNPGISLLLTLVRIPLFIKTSICSLLAWLSPRNTATAAFVPTLNPLPVHEERKMRAKRNECRQRWKEWMKTSGVDFVLSPMHVLPALPRGGTGVAGLVSADYGFLWNILDLPAGVVPTTSVSPTLDALPSPSPFLPITHAEAWNQFQRTPTYASLNDLDRQSWSIYDPLAMEGLPVSVQVVGGRFEEEKVLKGMSMLDEACRGIGEGYNRPELF